MTNSRSMGKTEKRAAVKRARHDDADVGPERPAVKSWMSRAMKRPLTVGLPPVLAVAAVPVVAAVLWPRSLELLEPDRVALGDMTVERFLREFSGARPVVVTGAWPSEGWQPDQVAGACPGAVIKTHRFSESSRTWAKHENLGEVPLQDYHAANFAADRSQRPTPLLYGFEMPLKTQCPKKLEAVVVPAFLGEDAFHFATNGSGLGWPSVLFGPSGTQTGLHIDTHRLPFWIAVVGEQGRALKRVRIFRHDHLKLLKYGKSEEGNNFHFDFDPWAPNLRRFPEVAEAPAYEMELHSGDLLYIPGGSPHAVVNLEDNLGISMNFLDLKSLPSFAKNCGPPDKRTGSPLCGMLAGRGDWVIDRLQVRRQQESPMSYFDFAGLEGGRAQFCAVHAEARRSHAPLEEYCSA